MLSNAAAEDVSNDFKTSAHGKIYVFYGNLESIENGVFLYLSFSQSLIQSQTVD